MDNRKLTIGITQGDSNGIGYEVIIKALADTRILEQFTPVIYGSSKMLGYYRKSIPEIEQFDTNAISKASDAHPRRINVLNCVADNNSAEPGNASGESAKAAIAALDAAVRDLKSGEIDAVVTAPINKESMSEAGFGFPGHTEYFQNAFGSKESLMFLVSEKIKIGVVTGHVAVKDVAQHISVDGILAKLRLMNSSLKQDFGIDRPKIAVLGLNPHSGDGGLLGKEEQDVIGPAIKTAEQEGIFAFGPFAADGFFGTEHYRKYDATLAMYHDQGLVPFKTIAFGDGVNFTAGLPVVRTSPDHGTAFEIAGQAVADPSSMRAAIYAAVDIVRNRESWNKLQEGKMPERSLDQQERRSNNGRPQIA